MNGGLIFGAFIILIFTLAMWLNWISRLKRSQPGASSTGSAESAMLPAERDAALERIQAAVTDLLVGVTGSLDTMTGDSTTYGRALAVHQESIERMPTIEDLRELEKRLLDQVKDVRSANDRYRRELDAANARVQEQQKDLERLQGSIGIDFLTELPNRQRLDEYVRDLMSRAERYQQRFSLVLLDIDHFKSINDEHGHAAGDRVLRAIAQLLSENKRASDFLARYGGEEFVLLLPETALGPAINLANKLRERISARNFQFQTQPIRLTLSAGVGEVLPGTDTADSLFDRVDKALYQAKNEGRNRVCVSAAPEVPA